MTDFQHYVYGCIITGLKDTAIFNTDEVPMSFDN